MPIAIQCPACTKPYNLPDTLQGKKVRCLDCRHEFTVSANAEPEVPIVEEVLPVETEPNPPARKPGKASAADRDVTTPQSRGRVPPPAKTRERDDPEPARRPNKTPTPTPTGGGVLIPLLMAGVVLLLSGIVVGISAAVTSSLAPDLSGYALNKPPVWNPGKNDWPGDQRPKDGGERPPVDNRPPGNEFPPVQPRKDPEPPLKPAAASRNLKPPEPMEGVGPVNTAARVVPEISVRYLTLKPLPCMTWSSDAKSFYAIENNGLLRRITLDDFQETKRLSVEHPTSWMTMSAEGLLVLLTDLKEVWVVDPDSLQVKNRLSVGGTIRVVSSPALSVAFVEGADGYLAALDLKTSQAREYNSRDFGSVGFEKLAITPDGKYLFGQGGTEQLNRFKIDGTKVLFEEATQRIAQNGQAICAGNEYVSLPSGGGNYTDIKGYPPTGGYSTYVYRVGNFTVPAFVVASGAYPRNMGFDPKARLVYAQGGTTELMVYSDTGVKQKDYRLDGSGWATQYLVHPDGRKLFVLTSNTNLFWVDLQGGGKDPVNPEGNDAFLGPKQNINGASVTTVNLPAKSTLPVLSWSADRKSFYALDTSGTLRRISLDGFKETMRSDIQSRCTWLAPSAEGLVVTVLGKQEIAVIDPDNFKLKRTIAAPLISRVLSAPSLSIGFGLSRPRPDEQEVTVFDLKKGEAIGKAKIERGRGAFVMSLITEDGKYLIGVDGAAMHRYKIDGTELKYEESSNVVGSGRIDRIQASPDGKFVCLPSGGGNVQDLPNHPKGKPYSTWVYPVTDLKKPEVLIASGVYPVTVAFDPKAELIYAQNTETPLIVYDYTGAEQAKYAIPGRGSDVKQFLPHPAGRKLLMFTSTGLAWVELPDKK